MQRLDEQPVQQTDEQPEFASPRVPHTMHEQEPYTIDGKTFTVLPREQLFELLKAIHPGGYSIGHWATMAHAEQKKLAAQYRARMKHAASAVAAAPSQNNGSESAQFDKPKNIAGMALQYMKAKGEKMINGQISDEDAATRLSMCRHGGVRCASCGAPAALDHESMEWYCDPQLYKTAKGCDWRMSHADAVESGAPPCPGYQNKGDQGEFCGRCGCGQRADAELKTKTTMRLATCPRRPSLWPTIKETK